MEKFIVRGEVQLFGSVRCSGAKNAALPIIAATLLGCGTSVIHDVPKLRDIKVMEQIIGLLGATVNWEQNTMSIDTTKLGVVDIPEHLMREMRASVFLMGPLLGRFKKVRISYPGGCAIGPRPIDLHLKALERLGAKVVERFGFIEAEASQLKGAEIQFDFPSVGATENAMMAAVTAVGITQIRNAAREPEIIDLQTFLNGMGAKVSGAGTDTIKVEGVSTLYPTEHTVMPDRIEAGTFLIAGAISRGDVVIHNVIPETLYSVTDKLQEMGAKLEFGSDFIRLQADELRATDIKTLPYPGFPTDLQAPMLALLSRVKGTSVVTETIFENRFKHIDELARMGARIRVEGRTAIIRGTSKLTGAIVAASDLRAGGCLVLAALAAEGTSEIKNVYYVDRGYERFAEKLRGLGADIIRS